MDANRATGVFGASFFLRGVVDVLGDPSVKHSAWVALGVLTLVASLSFWLGARGKTYRWFNPAVAGIVSTILVLLLLGSLPALSRWQLLATMVLAAAVPPLVFARVFESRPHVDSLEVSP